MYAKKYFKVAAKEITDEMVVRVTEEFKIMLKELDWMDEVTRERALKKADQITPHIAYPKEILNNKLIEEFYNGLVLPKDSYVGNNLHLTKWISAYYAKEFRKPIDKQSWKTHGGAAIVNAFYNSAENSINFPAGILEGAFFQEDRPLYMNYGAIGFVVGHEITHGFDDQGSQKDGEGNLLDWLNLPPKNATWRRLNVSSTNTGTILWRWKEKHSTSMGSTLRERTLPTMVGSRRRSGHTTELPRNTQPQWDQRSGREHCRQWWDQGGAQDIQQNCRETLNLNGINAQGENIADNGGIKEAL